VLNVDGADLKTYSVLLQRDGVLYKYTQLSGEENEDSLALNDEESKKWWKRPWADSDTENSENSENIENGSADDEEETEEVDVVSPTQSPSVLPSAESTIAAFEIESDNDGDDIERLDSTNRKVSAESGEKEAEGEFVIGDGSRMPKSRQNANAASDSKVDGVSSQRRLASKVSAQLKVIESPIDDALSVFGDDEIDLSYAASVSNAFLFAVSSDESELYNLLNVYLPTYSASLNDDIVEAVDAALTAFISDNALFSAPIPFLHTKLTSEAAASVFSAEPLFVRPFLENSQYASLIRKMFNDEDKNGRYHSEAQQALYYYAWVAPQRLDDEVAVKGAEDLTKNPVLIVLIVIILAALIVIASTIVIVYKCAKTKDRQKANANGYALILDHEQQRQFDVHTQHTHTQNGHSGYQTLI